MARCAARLPVGVAVSGRRGALEPRESRCGLGGCGEKCIHAVHFSPHPCGSVPAARARPRPPTIASGRRAGWANCASRRSAARGAGTVIERDRYPCVDARFDHARSQSRALAGGWVTRTACEAVGVTHPSAGDDRFAHPSAPIPYKRSSITLPRRHRPPAAQPGIMRRPRSASRRTRAGPWRSRPATRRPNGAASTAPGTATPGRRPTASPRHGCPGSETPGRSSRRIRRCADRRESPRVTTNVRSVQ
jgi:hypothetical protein